jgi:hypothetical protein
VQRFDSGPGDSVLIDAAWTVVSSKGARRSGRSVVQEKLKTMAYGSVAAGHSAALAAISREIAAAIRGQGSN